MAMLAKIKMKIKCVHARRAFSEQSEPRIQPLHVEHANGDGSDGVAGNAEEESWNPAQGDAGIVAGTRELGKAVSAAKVAFDDAAPVFVRRCYGSRASIVRPTAD